MKKTFLEVSQEINDKFLAKIVFMQTAIIKSRAKEGTVYSAQDLDRLTSVLKLWPHPLANNQTFQEGFKMFWQGALDLALNDIRRPLNPDLILSFIESNLDFFSKNELLEILQMGIDDCIKSIEETKKTTLAVDIFRADFLKRLENCMTNYKQENL